MNTPDPAAVAKPGYDYRPIQPANPEHRKLSATIGAALATVVLVTIVTVATVWIRPSFWASILTLVLGLVLIGWWFRYTCGIIQKETPPEEMYNHLVYNRARIKLSEPSLSRVLYKLSVAIDEQGNLVGETKIKRATRQGKWALVFRARVPSLILAMWLLVSVRWIFRVDTHTSGQQSATWILLGLAAILLALTILKYQWLKWARRPALYAGAALTVSWLIFPGWESWVEIRNQLWPVWWVIGAVAIAWIGAYWPAWYAWMGLATDKNVHTLRVPLLWMWWQDEDGEPFPYTELSSCKLSDAGPFDRIFGVRTLQFIGKGNQVVMTWPLVNNAQELANYINGQIERANRRDADDHVWVNQLVDSNNQLTQALQALQAQQWQPAPSAHTRFDDADDADIIDAEIVDEQDDEDGPITEPMPAVDTGSPPKTNET
jgi:hypothetical protein